MPATGSAETFRLCPKCDQSWPSREQFLGDPNAVLAGYQVHFQNLELGLFLFNHDCTSCGTTFALQARVFADLYSGPVYQERLTRSEECPEHCLQELELCRCPTHCECAWVREVLQIVAQWPRVPAQIQ